MATSNEMAFRNAMFSLIAAIVAYPWGLCLTSQCGRTLFMFIFWLVLDFTPPVLACVVGAEVLRQRWMHGRAAVGNAAVILAAIGLFLGALWLFLVFNTGPSPLPIPHPAAFIMATYG